MIRTTSNASKMIDLILKILLPFLLMWNRLVSGDDMHAGFFMSTIPDINKHGIIMQQYKQQQTTKSNLTDQNANHHSDSFNQQRHRYYNQKKRWYTSDLNDNHAKYQAMLSSLSAPSHRSKGEINKKLLPASKFKLVATKTTNTTTGSEDNNNNKASLLNDNYDLFKGTLSRKNVKNITNNHIRMHVSPKEQYYSGKILDNDFSRQLSKRNAHLNPSQYHLPKLERWTRNVQRQNLCESDCLCKQENNFVTVECDFSQNRLYILGHTKYIPKSAITLIIRLSPNGQLRLDEDLFHENRINKILIESQPHGKAHIEFGPKALLGNNGPFPEIDIINCHTAILRSNAFTEIAGEYKLNISHCIEVIIFPDAFFNTTFHGYLEHIADLHLLDKALMSNDKTRIEINNCYIDNLNRLDTSMKEIKFINSRINSIKSGAFDVLSITSIIFDQCRIGTFEKHSASVRLYSGYLAITGCTIETIEKEAIVGSGITKVLMQNNSIKSIEEKAIHLTAITVDIVNNSITSLGNQWFRVHDWHNVTIAHNKFGDYHRMIVDGTANPVRCIFMENFITNANDNSLNLTNTHCQVRDTFFMKPCICNFNWLQKLTTADIKAHSYCKIDSILRPCFNTSLFNVLKYENDICDYEKSKVDCVRNKVLKKIEDNFIDPDEIKDPKAYVTIVYIIVGCILLLSLIALVLVIAIKKIIQSRTITIPVSEMNHPVTLHGSLKQSKLFSNDDRVIINQTLENMKAKYPPEKYDQVYNNTKKLLDGNLTETDKVLTIGEIVRCLGECELSGEDFVAFTDILYKHLAPNGNNQNDPVYSEPILLDQQIENVYNVPDGQTNLDHIYAEPHSVQQPLLKNEYSSPLDKNESPPDFYTEPVVHPLDKQRHIISPYAIGNQLDNLPTNQQLTQNLNEPSISRNLPDVLNRTKQLTSLPTSSLVTTCFSNPSQSIDIPSCSSGDFSSNPKYHITRSPLTQRHIPKYTIPSGKNKQTTSHSPDSISSTSVSDHSGGSDVTYKIDDIIDYADA